MSLIPVFFLSLTQVFSHHRSFVLFSQPCEGCHLYACFVTADCWYRRSLRSERRKGRAGRHWACKAQTSLSRCTNDAKQWKQSGCLNVQVLVKSPEQPSLTHPECVSCTVAQRWHLLFGGSNCVLVFLGHVDWRTTRTSRTICEYVVKSAFCTRTFHFSELVKAIVLYSFICIHLFI